MGTRAGGSSNDNRSDEQKKEAAAALERGKQAARDKWDREHGR